MLRSGKVYMPKEYVKWKADFRILFGWQVSRQPISGPVRVDLVCVIPVPRTYTKTQREAALLGLTHVKGLGDVDNLAKSVLDVLTEIGLWEDDRQVNELRVRKKYGAQEEIQITVEKATLDSLLSSSSLGCPV